MKVIVILLAVLASAMASAQRSAYDDVITPAKGTYQVPSEAELRLHLAAFGCQITKYGIGFSALRDQGLEIDFVYTGASDNYRLEGFFYRLPPGSHGRKRYYFQGYCPLAVRATDKQLELHPLYTGTPGRECLDTSWFRFRSDLTADQGRLIEQGNIDVTMFDGDYKAGIVATFGPYVFTQAKPPLLFWLIWPDGQWRENGKRMTGERRAPLTFSIRIKD